MNSADSFNNNLNLYIPRASFRTTKEEVSDIFFKAQIGIVDYCDLVIIKDKETKQPLYMSVFIKLDAWNPLSDAHSDFEKNGSLKLKIGLSTTELWVILPNKNPLPRTHVNVSQLAASTEKLFDQNEKITERFGKFEDEIRSQMIDMRLFIELQQDTISALKTELNMTKRNNDILTANINKLVYHIKCNNNELVGYGYDTNDDL